MCDELLIGAAIWGGFALVCVALYATPFAAHVLSERQRSKYGGNEE